MYSLPNSKANPSHGSKNPAKFVLCLSVIALAIIAASSAISRPAATAAGGGSKITLQGTVFTWRGGASTPQDGVAIEVKRDGQTIAGEKSKDGGKFNFDIDQGPPVVMVFRCTGYVEGRVVCGVADNEDQIMNVALLSYQDAKQCWGDLAKEYFKF